MTTYPAEVGVAKGRFVSVDYPSAFAASEVFAVRLGRRAAPHNYAAMHQAVGQQKPRTECGRLASGWCELNRSAQGAVLPVPKGRTADMPLARATKDIPGKAPQAAGSLTGSLFQDLVFERCVRQRDGPAPPDQIGCQVFPL